MSKDWRSFVYGGIASMVAEIVTFPMDTTKTRLQVQGQKMAADKSIRKIQYKGMIDALIKITKEEGIKTLYSGVKPALLRQATYGSLKFGIYQQLKGVMKSRGILIDPVTSQERVAINIFCGASAGALSSSLTNPADVLKVRLQQHPHIDQRLIRGFYAIYAAEGIHGLWRGVSGTAQRAAITTSAGLPTYDFVKLILTPYLGDEALNHFLSAVCASINSSVLSTPFDVLRTRVMEQSTDSTRAYKGVLDCFRKTVKTEGIFALYKGLVPILIRMGPWNTTFFVTYEQLRRLY